MHRDRGRPRSFATRWPRRAWIAVLLVLILLLSSLPSLRADAPSSATSPTAAALPPLASTPTRAANSPSLAPKAVERSTDPDGDSLCSLGVLPYCSGRYDGSPNAPASPDGSAPSSWKDITPPSNNPAARTLPAETYYPSGHDDVLFGGTGFNTTDSETIYYGDTWSFANHVWTELIANTSCTPTTCPSGRAGAMIAYYPASNALILFGGYITVQISEFYYTVVYNDTWMFSGGTWTNITSSTGTAPSPRFEGAMTYDPSDNEILLFGGSNANGNSLGDTWTFSAGQWKNITADEGGPTGYTENPSLAPSPRAGAAVANSPAGYVMLFGGENTIADGTPITIENNCYGSYYYNQSFSVVAWWFYQGKWAPVGGWADTEAGLCAPPPPPIPTTPNAVPFGPALDANPPCGRVSPALGWSPQNERFVLYGGKGPIIQAGVCSGLLENLNDTWTYAEPTGGGFYWAYAGDSGDPRNSSEMGYASDFTDGYFEIFGGTGATVADFGTTWRFYEIVHSGLTGPTAWDTAGINLINNGPFVASGYGGSGDLSISFTETPLKDKLNTLDSGTGCGWFYNGTSTILDFQGVLTFHCEPGPSSFNVYRLTALVIDEKNSSDRASASWIFTVVPPEAENIYSEYIGYFYSTVSFTNRFTIFTEVDDIAASKISASMDGVNIPFTQSSGDPNLWNASVNMAPFPAGTDALQAEAYFGGAWTQNATYDVTEVNFPGWLLSVFAYVGATESIHSVGAGPYNKSFIINESYAWNLDNALGFSFPMELLGGDYNTVPSLMVVFTVTSEGDLSVQGKLPLSLPTIDIGVASITVTASFSLSGTFDVVGTGVHWVQAEAIVQISADLSASIPIYGFSILGIDVGFYLQVNINPAVTLNLILAPATTPSQDLIPGIGIMIQKFFGSFSLALSASVNFGIGIASIGLGAGVSVALEFVLNPGISIEDGWVNGSIFVTASFLWWSDSWNIISGTIYSWDPPASFERGDSTTPSGYNNDGNGTKWVTQGRYYASGSYDGYTWNAVASSGPAISDIYPYTEVSGAPAYDGDDFFYTNDNIRQPITDGLGIGVAHLNSTSNTLTELPAIDDPGYYEVVAPQATTLPDGNVYVLWAGLPNSEATISSPLNLTSLALQGAPFYPNNDTWGPIHTFSSTRFAESYQVDATHNAGDVLELVANTPLVGDATPESLIEYDLSTGAVLANISVVGESEVVSLRGDANLTEVQGLNGNFTLLGLPTGTPLAIAYQPPIGDVLSSASFVEGSTSALVLLYRGGNGSELVLYDADDTTPIAALPLGGNTFEAEGIASGDTYYVFVRTTTGIMGWSESGSTFSNLTSIGQLKTQNYGLVQVGGSIVVYSLAITGGNSSFPIKSLEFDEIGAALPPVPIPASVKAPTTTSPGPGPNYLLYLGMLAVAVVLLLAVVYLLTRRRPPPDALAPWVPAGAADPTPTDAPTPPSG
jgi:hypothetical protein